MIRVKIATIGGNVEEVESDAESLTVEEVLAQTETNTKEKDLRVNDEAVCLDHMLKDGDIITLVPKIEGGF